MFEHVYRNEYGYMDERPTKHFYRSFTENTLYTTQYMSRNYKRPYLPLKCHPPSALSSSFVCIRNLCYKKYEYNINKYTNRLSF